VVANAAARSQEAKLKRMLKPPEKTVSSDSPSLASAGEG
jgi:hypothetical protein